MGREKRGGKERKGRREGGCGERLRAHRIGGRHPWSLSSEMHTTSFRTEFIRLQVQLSVITCQQHLKTEDSFYRQIWKACSAINSRTIRIINIIIENCVT